MVFVNTLIKTRNNTVSFCENNQIWVFAIKTEPKGSPDIKNTKIENIKKFFFVKKSFLRVCGLC